MRNVRPWGGAAVDDRNGSERSVLQRNGMGGTGSAGQAVTSGGIGMFPHAGHRAAVSAACGRSEGFSGTLIMILKIEWRGWESNFRRTLLLISLFASL